MIVDPNGKPLTSEEEREKELERVKALLTRIGELLNEEKANEDEVGLVIVNLAAGCIRKIKTNQEQIDFGSDLVANVISVIEQTLQMSKIERGIAAKLREEGKLQ